MNTSSCTEEQLLPTEQQTLYQLTRQAIYLILHFLIVILLWQLGSIYHTALIREHGIIETLQSAILLVAALSYLHLARSHAAQRPLQLLLCALCLAALIREQDAWLETHLPYISWYFCYLLPLAALGYLLRHRKHLRRPLFQLLRTHAFHMLITAAIILIPIAQGLGHRSFLLDVMNSPHLNGSHLRRLIEESLEILAYAEILFSSIELHLELTHPPSL